MMLPMILPLLASNPIVAGDKPFETLCDTLPSSMRLDAIAANPSGSSLFFGWNRIVKVLSKAFFGRGDLCAVVQNERALDHAVDGQAGLVDRCAGNENPVQRDVALAQRMQFDAARRVDA